MFNIKDWFWVTPSHQVYSSGLNETMQQTDERFEAWVAAGNTPTFIPTIQAALGVVINGTDLFSLTDITMSRIAEAVALGLNTWTGSDIVAYVNYRRALRAIISGTDTTTTSIPHAPAYPAGT